MVGRVAILRPPRPPCPSPSHGHREKPSGRQASQASGTGSSPAAEKAQTPALPPPPLPSGWAFSWGDREGGRAGPRHITVAPAPGAVPGQPFGGALEGDGSCPGASRPRFIQGTPGSPPAPPHPPPPVPGAVGAARGPLSQAPRALVLPQRLCPWEGRRLAGPSAAGLPAGARPEVPLAGGTVQAPDAGASRRGREAGGPPAHLLPRRLRYSGGTQPALGPPAPPSSGRTPIPSFLSL